MAELRRIFIDNKRLENDLFEGKFLRLTSKEFHYIKRVLRLNRKKMISVVDGFGHLWNAKLSENNYIEFCTPIDSPELSLASPKTLLCLAVVIPKQGFDETIRMCSEIGVDIIQPLISDRSVVKKIGNDRLLRWNQIINEAVEQSERLWKPEMKKPCDFIHWIDNSTSIGNKFICLTRSREIESLESWLNSLSPVLNQVWGLVGPEGGWTTQEQLAASKNGLKNVCFGETILRTSTAAVSASQLMASWRRTLT